MLNQAAETAYRTVRTQTPLTCHSRRIQSRSGGKCAENASNKKDICAHRYSYDQYAALWIRSGWRRPHHVPHMEARLHRLRCRKCFQLVGNPIIVENTLIKRLELLTGANPLYSLVGSDIVAFGKRSIFSHIIQENNDINQIRFKVAHIHSSKKTNQTQRIRPPSGV